MLIFFFFYWPSGQVCFGKQKCRGGFFLSPVFSWPSLPGIWPIKQEPTNQDISGITAAVLEAPAAKGSRIIPLAFAPESQLTQVGPSCLGMEEMWILQQDPWWLAVQALSSHVSVFTVMQLHILHDWNIQASLIMLGGEGGSRLKRVGKHKVGSLF